MHFWFCTLEKHRCHCPFLGPSEVTQPVPHPHTTVLTKRSEDCRERHLQPSRIQLPLTSPASSETPCLLLAPSRSCAISHLYVPALLSFLCLKSTSFLPPPLSTVILMSGSSSNINMQASLLGSAAHDGGGQKPTRRPPCPGPWISQLPFLYLVSSSLNNNYDDNIYITWLLRIKPVHLSRMLIKNSGYAIFSY